MAEPFGEPGGTGTDAGAASRLLLEALRSGGGSLPTLLSFLSNSVSPEQRTVLDLLQTLQQDGDGGEDGDSGEDDDDEEDGDDDAGDDADADTFRERRAHAARTVRRAPGETVQDPLPDAQPGAGRLSALRRELAALREVNDTVAAALGACPACWGGDDDCPYCGGHGSAGTSLPDLRLFEALVVPAVQRLHSAQRVHARPGAAGARRHPSPSTEASP